MLSGEGGFGETDLERRSREGYAPRRMGIPRFRGTSDPWFRVFHDPRFRLILVQEFPDRPILFRGTPQQRGGRVRKSDDFLDRRNRPRGAAAAGFIRMGGFVRNRP
jgi:hypothetical protein